MSRRALYFGPQHRPLFGWLHEPDSGATGVAAVLCPSLGLEALAAHQTYRRLAERLAATGTVALRLDYEGTGDSAGAQTGAGQVRAWVASVTEAVRALRAAGATTVVCVGLRAGALLASAASADAPPDGLVLWDPPSGGRAFLREQRALRMLSIEAPVVDDGSVEGPGVVFDAATAADLGALGLDAGAAAGSAALLLLVRAGAGPPAAAAALAARPGALLEQVAGQAELFDVQPDMAQVPAATVDRVAAWCAALAPAGPAAAFAFAAREEARLELADGSQAVERPLRLGGSGPFAVLTEPAAGSPSATVLLSNAGVLPHVGPARVWVELARQLAAHGARVARMDQSGIGDTPPRAGRSENVVYSPDALDDYRAAVEALDPRSPADVVLAGLCSGAYHAIETGRVVGSRLVCAVNPILTFSPPEVEAGAPLDGRRGAVEPLRWPFRVLARHGRAVATGERLPPPAWWLLDRLGLQPSPGRGLERLVAGGTQLLLVCGEEDARPFRRRAGPLLRRLERSGSLRFEVVPGLDHTMLARTGREAAAGLVAAHLTERIGATADHRGLSHQP